MRTRILLATLALLVALPLSLEAQLPARVYRIGILEPSTTADSAKSWEAFRAGLRDLGWIEGKNILFESRSAENKYDRLPALAVELVRLKVDMLVTYTTPGALAAKRATTTIPIVVVTSTDAVAAGVVASLARPGGNVTGSTFMGPEVYVKQLELLKAVIPRLRHVARVVNPDSPVYKTLFKEGEQAAASMKIGLSFIEARRADDLAGAFTAAVARGVEAVVITRDPMILASVKTIADIAVKHRLPSIGNASFVGAGGMLGFGTIPLDQFRRAPYFVDRILKGTRPADLPVEQPTRFELVVNLKTAKALGVTIPQSILVRADRVIE